MYRSFVEEFKEAGKRPLQERERQTIKSGTEILDGVLYGRVGLVVDTSESPGPYKALIDKAMDSLTYLADISTADILKAVYNAVNNKVRFSPNGYGVLLSTEAKSQGSEWLASDYQIGLSRFIVAGTGVCHQHALACGACLRLLQEQGMLSREAEVSIESRPDEIQQGRHTSVSFIEESQEYILNNETGVYLQKPLAVTY